MRDENDETSSLSEATSFRSILFSMASSESDGDGLALALVAALDSRGSLVSTELEENSDPLRGPDGDRDCVVLDDGVAWGVISEFEGALLFRKAKRSADSSLVDVASVAPACALDASETDFLSLSALYCDALVLVADLTGVMISDS